MRNHVLLEFGIRNDTEPKEKCIITPYLAKVIDDTTQLPQPEVDALSPLRTFWEKATLIHVECQRGRLSQTPDRLSRHWYGLFMLLQSWVGEQALMNLEVLHNVLNHKKDFFNASYANYDKCLSGNFQLIPDEESLKGLQKDYDIMQNAGMFTDKPPELKDILNRINEFQKQFNNTCD